MNFLKIPKLNEHLATLTDTTNIDFQLAADFVKYTNASIFLTGKAGTGKTTFLKYCKENETKNTAIVAPTGVAAMNAGGTTIHSFFQLPFGPFIPVSKGISSGENINDKHSLISRLRLSNDRKEVMQKLDLLIIDEISMVRCDVLDAIDTVLRYVRSQHARPFGGVQLLLIGDLYQLPPVIKEEEWKILSPYYKSQYFFNSEVIESQPPVYIELNKIYRQSDAAFVDVLNQVRNNELNKQGYDLLHQRYLPDFNPGKNQNYITLTTHNNKADSINFKELNEIKSSGYHFNAEIEGEFYEKSFPADLNLKLKIGAQVMFIKNDTEKIRRYFNGKIGIVDKIEDNKIFVTCKEETHPIEVKKEKWRNIRYVVDKLTNVVEEKEIGSFTQYPLRLAWAITIHKSQGLTFENAIIDAGNAFAPGQVYVALSRCTNMEGMVLHSKINSQSLHSDTRISAFSQAQKTTGSQLELLFQAKFNFQKEAVYALFDFAEIDEKAKRLHILMKDAANTFNAEAFLWIENITGIISTSYTIAKKFAQQLDELMNEFTLPEKNEALQTRIVAAIKHFTGNLDLIKEQITHPPFTIDSKILAAEFNKLLQDVYQIISLKVYLYINCKNGFFVEVYLKHKRIFATPFLPVNIYAGKNNLVKNVSPHPDLHKLLRKERDKICDQKDIPLYLVCNTIAIDEMATYLPQSTKELIQLSGFGKIKAEQYGEQFLNIIRKYCDEYHLASNISEKPIKQKRIAVSSENKINENKIKSTVNKKSSTKTETFRLYNEGVAIEDIAVKRGLTISTIENHLAHFISTGDIEISKIVSQEKQTAILSAAEKFGQVSHKLIKENVTIDIGYGEIKLVMASLKNNEV